MSSDQARPAATQVRTARLDLEPLRVGAQGWLTWVSRAAEVRA